MNMKNLFPKQYRTSLTIGTFLTLPVVLAGTWFLWRELFFDHWKKTVQVETPSAQSITKESVDKLNNTLRSNKKDDCEKISNANLRDVCYDNFIMNEAKQSPLQAQEICNKLRQKFQVNACMSSVNMEKALTSSGSTPSSSCEILTDPRWRDSCIDQKENDALNNALSQKKVSREFCNQLKTDRIKADCLAHVSP